MRWVSNVTNDLIFKCLDALNLRYARALDRHDLRDWASCFAAKASYICISYENVEQGLPVALMMDDTRARIEDRIRAVEDVWAGTFEDYRTRHFVQRMTQTLIVHERWSMESNFLVAYTTAQGDTQMLTSGVYLDELVLERGEARLISRKAVLDSIATPRYLAYPI